MKTRRATEPRSADAARSMKAAQRAMWALGNYHQFAMSTTWQLGPVLVEACRIETGQRVLDVATGTGNVAIRAAMTGAAVVASDLTPENFDAGRRAARAAGVELEWIEADAEALPFDDDEFDVVTSCFGAIFAPDQQKAADELVRVCRPGGTIGMINFTPEGTGGEFFRLLGSFMPPSPDDAPSPLSWGEEEQVRRLFGDRVEALTMTRHVYVERAESAQAYRDMFTQTFGPMIAIRSSLADQPERHAALENCFLKFVNRADLGSDGGEVQVPYEYLIVLARKRPRNILEQSSPERVGESSGIGNDDPLVAPARG